MFGWEYPPFNSGGLGVACHGLANALVNKDVNIDFVLPKNINAGEGNINFLYADSSKIINLAVKSLLTPYISTNSYLKSLSFAIGKPIYGRDLFEEVDRYAMQSMKLIENRSCDVIHAHDWLSFGAGVLAKKEKRAPLVTHVHATEYDRTGGPEGNLRVHEIEKGSLEIADKVIAVSNLTKNIIVDKYKIPERKIEVVHNGIEKRNYIVDADSLPGLLELKKLGYKIVLFVGRITLSKGVDNLLKAAKKVLTYDSKVIFVIAGSGEMERQIIDLSCELGISSNVIFAGFARGEELSSLYKSADLFIMPSISEPFGLTALESLIHKTPALISKQSGVSEVLEHVLKVDFWDIDEMTNKILACINYDSLKNTLAQNGQKEAFRQTWGQAADKCLKIYNSLII